MRILVEFTTAVDRVELGGAVEDATPGGEEGDRS